MYCSQHNILIENHYPIVCELISLLFFLSPGPPDAYMDSTRLLKDISVQKRTYLLQNYIYDIAAIPKTLAFGIIHNGKKIAKFTFAEFEVFDYLFCISHALNMLIVYVFFLCLFLLAIKSHYWTHNESIKVVFYHGVRFCCCIYQKYYLLFDIP